MKLDRRGRSGQAAVETALMMPFTIFMILGIIQLSLMQQARLLTQYAAYRAARAGALGQAVCQTMTDAAVEGILASYGETDTAAAIKATWTKNDPNRGFPKDNKTNSSASGSADLQKIVRISYEVEDINGTPGSPYGDHDFDDPGKGLRLNVQVIYNYEMRIPFANWMIHEMWTGGNYFNDKVNLLSPSMEAHSTEISKNANLVNSTTSHAGGVWRFFLPIPTSSSMRMMSNPMASVTIGTGVQKCP